MNGWSYVRVPVARPHKPADLAPDCPIVSSITVEVDLERRVVTVQDVPELGELDLDSVIRLADSLRVALDVYRDGILKIPSIYGPQDHLVLRWLHRYVHERGLESDDIYKGRFNTDSASYGGPITGKRARDR